MAIAFEMIVKILYSFECGIMNERDKVYQKRNASGFENLQLSVRSFSFSHLVRISPDNVDLSAYLVIIITEKWWMGSMKS